MSGSDNRRLIQTVLDALDARGEQYRVLYGSESEDAVSWLEQAFPVATWGRILWDKVPSSRCTRWATLSDLEHRLRECCERESLDDLVVVVVWSNALRPGLELSLSSAVRHATPIFEADWDTWVLCRVEGWCLEVYHEREICFGRSTQT
jgi:hypothetical protein